MKVLITGGAGFIGSSVAKALLARGDEVRILDNFNDFYDPALKRENAAALLELGATLTEGDIRDVETMKSALEGVDGVIHLAAMAGVRPSLENPLHYEDVNVRGTLILLEELRKKPETKLVFASSSSVYGSNEKVPFEETDDIHHPVSPYAATKRAGELVCYTHHHLYGIPIAALRFFTVYGPGQRPEMAIHKFVRAIMRGEEIPFFGDGTTRRDYTYIDDIVDGVVKSLDHCEGYEIYNLGESETTSLADLCMMIGEACGKEVKYNRLPSQPGDVTITYADVSKAKAKIGYAPKTKMREGLANFVEWYKRERLERDR